MKVTEIKVFPVREEKLKAFVSIVIDRCFMVNDIKVIRGREDLFISMPSRRKKNGKFKDVAHPLNNETRQMIEGLVLEEYRRAVGAQDAAEESVAPAAAPAAAGEAPAEPAAQAQEPQPEPEPAPAAAEAVPAAQEQSASEAPTSDEPTEPVVEAQPAQEEPAREAAPAPDAPAEEAEDSEDKSLEEVTELHLRDSFWST